MSSVRLFSDQARRLKARNAPASLILETAVARYRAGEIVVTRSEPKAKNRPKVLQSWRKRPRDLTDSQIRAILDAHFTTPVNFSKEISRLTSDIETMMAATCRRVIPRLAAQEEA